jgi:hypothetical protein
MKAVGDFFTGEDQRERLGTVLHVLAQCVVDLNTILSPFLPHAANAVDRVYGGTGDLQPMPGIEEVNDLDDGSRAYPVITGGYSGACVAPYPSRGRRVRRQADPGVHQARPLGRQGGTSPPGMTPNGTRLAFSYGYSP